jgi:hypothetical protein
MAAYFPDFHDAQLRLPAYWADCELRLAGDAAAARAVWEAALKSVSGRRGAPPPSPRVTSVDCAPPPSAARPGPGE